MGKALQYWSRAKASSPNRCTVERVAAPKSDPRLLRAYPEVTFSTTLAPSIYIGQESRITPPSWTERRVRLLFLCTVMAVLLKRKRPLERRTSRRTNSQMLCEGTEVVWSRKTLMRLLMTDLYQDSLSTRKLMFQTARTQLQPKNS